MATTVDAYKVVPDNPPNEEAAILGVHSWSMKMTKSLRSISIVPLTVTKGKVAWNLGAG